jgi:hypothetical protein
VPDTAQHARLASEYADTLSDVVDSEERFRDVMRAFGDYLRRHGVRPEHVVICVRHSLEHARLHAMARELRLSERAVRWAVQGYYAESGDVTQGPNSTLA